MPAAPAGVIVDVKPHTAAWWAWRAQGIGGSDAGVITGDDPFHSPMSLWLEKSGFLEREHDSDSEPQYWGRLLEPAVIERFERDTGLLVARRQLCMQSDVDAWRRATIDGLVCESTDVHVAQPDFHELPGDVLGIFEGKTTSKYAEWAEGPPAHVQLQVQHNLDVAGLDRAWLSVLFTAPVVHFATYELALEPSIAVPLRALEARFWRRVLEGDAPPAQSSDLDDLKRAYERSVEDNIELDGEAAGLVLELDRARNAKRYAEDYVDGVQARLAALLREHETGVIDGEPAIHWRRHSKTYVDVDAIKLEAPELVAKHTTQRPYRQFTVAKRRRPLVVVVGNEGDGDEQSH